MGQKSLIITLLSIFHSVFTNEKVLTYWKEVVFCDGFLERDIEKFSKSPTDAAEERTRIQSILNFALQNISIRLNTLFFKDQDENRKEIEKLVKVNELASKKKIGSVSTESLRLLLSKEEEISQEITSLKGMFTQIIDLAKMLGLEVFDGEAYRYNWYLVLKVGDEYGHYFRHD